MITHTTSLCQNKARFQPDFHISHCGKTVRFVVLKSYLPISTYKIYHCLHFLTCSLVTNFMPLLCQNPELALTLPVSLYEQFVNIHCWCIIYYAYMSLYDKCPNVSVKAVHVSVQYSYPSAYRESHYKLKSLGLL